MRIEKLVALPVSLPVAPFADAYGYYDRLSYVIVKANLETGVIGVIEGSPIDPSFYGETQQSIVREMKRFGFWAFTIGGAILERDFSLTRAKQIKLERR